MSYSFNKLPIINGALDPPSVILTDFPRYDPDNLLISHVVNADAEYFVDGTVMEDAADEDAADHSTDGDVVEAAVEDAEDTVDVADGDAEDDVDVADGDASEDAKDDVDVADGDVLEDAEDDVDVADGDASEDAEDDVDVADGDASEDAEDGNASEDAAAEDASEYYSMNGDAVDAAEEDATDGDAVKNAMDGDAMEDAVEDMDGSLVDINSDKDMESEDLDEEAGLEKEANSAVDEVAAVDDLYHDYDFYVYDSTASSSELDSAASSSELDSILDEFSSARVSKQRTALDELLELQQNPTVCYLITEVSLQSCYILIAGLGGNATCGEYICRITIPERYPIEAPVAQFLSINGVFDPGRLIQIDPAQWASDSTLNGFITWLTSLLLNPQLAGVKPLSITAMPKIMQSIAYGSRARNLQLYKSLVDQFDQELAKRLSLPKELSPICHQINRDRSNFSSLIHRSHLEKTKILAHHMMQARVKPTVGAEMDTSLGVPKTLFVKTENTTSDMTPKVTEDAPEAPEALEISEAPEEVPRAPEDTSEVPEDLSEDLPEVPEAPEEVPEAPEALSEDDSEDVTDILADRLAALDAVADVVSNASDKDTSSDSETEPEPLSVSMLASILTRPNIRK